MFKGYLYIILSAVIYGCMPMAANSSMPTGCPPCVSDFSATCWQCRFWRFWQ